MKSSGHKGKKVTGKATATGQKSKEVDAGIVMNPIHDGVVSVDNNWNYTYLNDAALATHPLGREETLGKSIWDVHPEMKGTIFWEKYHEAMETRKVVEVESHYAPMNTWFFAKVYPSGTGLTILYMDITARKRAEQETLFSHKRQRAVLESTFDAIWSVDPQYRLLFCNSLFRKFITDLSGKEIQLGDDIRGFIPEGYEEWIPFCARALNGEAFSIDLQKSVGRNKRIQEYFFTPIKDRDGKITGISVSLRDITERNKVQRDYEASELRYQSLISQLSDALFVADTDGNYIDVNPSACTLSGYTREELLGMNVRDLLFGNELKDLIARDETSRKANPDTVESILKRKDGTAVDIEINSKILNNGSYVGIVREITERKRAQQAIDKSEKRFRAMIENGNDVIALVNKELKPFYHSPSAARVTGYSMADLAVRDSFSEIHPEDRGRMGETTKEILRSPGKAVPSTFRIRHKDGHFIWVEGTFTNMFEDPDVNAIVVNMREVTNRKNAEEKLIDNERRFRALIENISDGIVLNDSEYNLLFQSSSVTRILGYTWEDRKNKPVTDFIHPDNRKQFEELYVRLKESPGISFPFQYRIKHKAGHYVWLEGVVTNLLHEPSVNAFVANYRDISDRKEAEQKLHRERTLLRTVIDNVPDFIYAKDTDYRYLVVNKASLNIMGVTSQKDALGKTSADMFGAETVKTYHKDDEQLFKTGKAILDREEMIMGSSGTPKFLLTTKVPIRDTQNNITGLVAISKDITKQKQIELELRNSNYFLATAQRAGKIGYWISDLSQEGKLIWSTETCNIFGIDPQKFDQRVETFYKIVYPEDRELVNEAARFAISDIAPYSVDHRITLPDGSIKWLHEQGEVTFDEKGQPFQLVGIVQDITERKQAEHEVLVLNAELEERVKIRTAELQAANKEMESFTYSVSHDLRSPLRIIDGYAQILVEDFSEIMNESAMRSLNVIMQNAKKMGKLIDDLLDFSRIGRAEIRKLTVNMGDLVAEVLEDLRFGGVKMPLQIEIKPLLPGVCDPNLIKHVWVNLLSNAIKYSGNVSNPAIEVGMIQDNDRLAYYVKDNGAGFDMQYYHKLFGVFQRLHSHHEFTGTGVGLAIVQRIIIRHGGSVWAESKINEGSTFYFSLE